MNHLDVYAAAALYDLAFSYRDYAVGAAFLSRVFEHATQRAPRSFLELAAGPARHALAMIARGVPAAALDLSPDMASYGRKLAAELGATLDYLTADMRDFVLPAPVDFVACMLCSATYLLTDDDFIAHLRATARSLTPEGRYLLELPHPSEVEGHATTKDTWTVRAPDGELRVLWRELDEPSSQGPGVRTCLARLEWLATSGATFEVEQRAPQRAFRREDLERLVSDSGCFQLESLFGALDERVALDAPKAWRMVAVLKKPSG
jgi:SAM-dependent methyltransferase